MDSDNSYRPHRIDRDAYAQKLNAMSAMNDRTDRPQDMRNLKLTAFGLILFAGLSQVAVLVAAAGYAGRGIVLLVLAILQITAGIGLLTRKKLGYIAFNVVAALTVTVMLFLMAELLSAVIVVVSVINESPAMAGLSLVTIVSQLFALIAVCFGMLTLNSEPARRLFR